MSSPSPESGEGAFSLSIGAFFAALQFLTITPPVIHRPFTLRELGGSVVFYPIVGGLIGLVLLGADTLLRLVLPMPVSSAFVLAIWVLITGALHLDGFLDACDGLLGGHTPEMRLQIMRDEHIGAYALTGGILLLILKFTALSALSDRTIALLLAPILGRWGIVLALAVFPYARSQGLGRDIKDHVTKLHALLATLITLLISVFVARWIGILAIAAAILVLLIISIFTLHRIPGMTGDIYGALNESIELAVLLTMVVWAQWISS